MGNMERKQNNITVSNFFGQIRVHKLNPLSIGKLFTNFNTLDIHSLCNM